MKESKMTWFSSVGNEMVAVKHIGGREINFVYPEQVGLLGLVVKGRGD